MEARRAFSLDVVEEHALQHGFQAERQQDVGRAARSSFNRVTSKARLRFGVLQRRVQLGLPHRHHEGKRIGEFSSGQSCLQCLNV